MRKLVIGLAAGLVLALGIPAALGAPPPPSTTTTTTLPPAPSTTRGVITCPDGQTGPWSAWIQMGANTQVAFNGSRASVDVSGPNVGIGFSTDGVNPVLPDPPNSTSLALSPNAPSFFNTVWPYLRFRCENSTAGTPVIVWKVS